MENNKNKFLFVHIPKTAGSSITDVLTSINSDNWLRSRNLKHHESISQLRSKNNIPENTKIFSVVRNPFTRTISYYYHFLRINKLNNFTIFDFLNIVETKENPFKATPLIAFDQSYYLTEENGELYKENIFKYENLIEVSNFLGKPIPMINVGEYDNELLNDNKVLDKIKTIYKNDFINFNYSTNPHRQ